MSKLSEYQCKKLFYENDDYFVDYLNKVKLTINKSFDKNEKFVIKVDNGEKHRMLRGLVKIGLTLEECINFVNSQNNNYNYVIEKCKSKEEIESEIYVLIRCDKEYDEIIVNYSGGINLNNPEENSVKYKVYLGKEFDHSKYVDLDSQLGLFLRAAHRFFVKYHFTFMEINPVAKLTNGTFIPLDFAVLIDKDALYLFPNNEIMNMDYYGDESLTFEEKEIKKLDERTGGSLKFKLLNPQGKIWTLIAGGGASVVFTDAITNMGYSQDLANYGEYSGDPPATLVKLYCTHVFRLMGKVDGAKILFIGGGIANFTDVAETFSGIIDAISEMPESFKDVIVYVRRGGPGWKKGLDNLKNCLDKYNIINYMYGPDLPITNIVKLALEKKEELDNNKYLDALNLDAELGLNNLLENKINYRIDKNTKCILYGYNKKAAQRMLDFDKMCGKNSPSIVGVIDPRESKNRKDPIFWGNESLLLDIYTNLEDCINSKTFDTVINFMSFRSATTTTMELLEIDTIKNIIIIAEGVAERDSRKLGKKAREKGVLLLGPATVGGIIGGEFRIANTGGSLENIIDCGLNKKDGQISFVTRSGGLLNELSNIVSKVNGVRIGMSIGGDRWPSSTFVDHVMNLEQDEKTKAIIILGEVGGIQELLVAQAKKLGLISKPVIGWCMGISAEKFGKNVQFGHAGSSANSGIEKASFKNRFMKECGIIVPNSFEELSEVIEQICNKLELNSLEKGIEIGIEKIKDNRKLPSFYSSISNELGDELTYNNIKISNLLGSGIGKTIGHLWLKTDIPDWFSKFIELVLIVVADHGALVSGAHNTIVAARAGKDLVSSLCSGLLTIGDYFGGALNKSAAQFIEGVELGLSPEEFVEAIKKRGDVIYGIGHKLKTKENPDMRVEILKKYVFENFPKFNHVDFALKVEQVTLRKKNNLILNVDGFIANAMLDGLTEILGKKKAIEIVNNEFINAFFILGRTIGFIGHWHDQKRLGQGLFRVPEDDVQYL